MSVNRIDDVLKSVDICTILNPRAARYYTMARRRGLLLEVDEYK